MSASSKFLSHATHLKSVVDVGQLSLSKVEVCFLGRSNVGKSSLINALCAKKNMAHASQLPGKTRLINVYEPKKGHWLVDLPGYGFAVGGAKAKQELGAIIESYLNDRENLQMVYLVIDAVAGFTKLDVLMTNWLKHYCFPFIVVVNKIDKIPSPQLNTRKQELLEALSLEDNSVFWVSTTKMLGVLDLQHHVVSMLQSKGDSSS